ncbi:MAG: hypothetical protein HYU80_04060 [Candidatus Blackburnbacteria bacterium]|nr:hypothetical protein [Candidatus Blackburnbacteria bacterium]
MLHQAILDTSAVASETTVGLPPNPPEGVETPRTITLALGDSPLTIIVRNTKTGECTSIEGTEIELKLPQ